MCGVCLSIYYIFGLKIQFKIGYLLSCHNTGSSLFYAWMIQRSVWSDSTNSRNIPLRGVNKQALCIPASWCSDFDLLHLCNETAVMFSPFVAYFYSLWTICTSHFLSFPSSLLFLLSYIVFIIYLRFLLATFCHQFSTQCTLFCTVFISCLQLFCSLQLQKKLKNHFSDQREDPIWVSAWSVDWIQFW